MSPRGRLACFRLQRCKPSLSWTGAIRHPISTKAVDPPVVPMRTQNGHRTSSRCHPCWRSGRRRRDDPAVCTAGEPQVVGRGLLTRDPAEHGVGAMRARGPAARLLIRNAGPTVPPNPPAATMRTLSTLAHTTTSDDPPDHSAPTRRNPPAAHLRQPVKGQGPKRPHAMKAASAK
jgi:hypothetical protein